MCTLTCGKNGARDGVMTCWAVSGHNPPTDACFACRVLTNGHAVNSAR